MKYAESTPSRRVVGQFENGETLPDALVDLCQSAGIRAGEVRAQGTLKEVDLAIFSVDDAEWRSGFKSDGAVELLSVMGNISTMGGALVINAKAQVAYLTHGRSHTVGGQLQSATCLAVEFVIDVFDDLELKRGLNADTNLPLFNSIERLSPPATKPVNKTNEDVPKTTSLDAPKSQSSKPKPKPKLKPKPKPERAVAEPVKTAVPEVSQPKPSRPIASQSEWEAAARRAQSPREDELDDDDYDDDAVDPDDVELKPGDTLLHPRLGECTVVRADDAAAYIRIQKSQKISKLALSVVRLEPTEDRDGKRVFKVRAGNQ